MKNVVLGFLGIGICLSVCSGVAKAETAQLLLNYQEWSALPADEQLQYLKELQKVMAGMDERSEFFAKAQAEMALSRAPANAKTSAKFDFSEHFATVSENNLTTTEQLLKKAGQVKDPEKKLIELKRAADLIEKTRYGIILITQERLSVSTYKKWQAVRSELSKEKINSFSNEQKHIDNVDNIINTLKLSKATIASLNKSLAKEKVGSPEYKKLSALIANNETAYNVARDELKKNQVALDAAEADYKKAILLLPKKKEGEFFRCMYAGFVLKEDCKAPSKLPKDLKLTGIAPNNFGCDKSLVLCNPLLFGGAASCPIDAKTNKEKAAQCLSDMKGFCKPKSSSATRDCLEEAEKSPNNLENTALLIHANPDAWNDYTNSFHSLCDEEKISQNTFTRQKGDKLRPDSDHVKKDIAKTCDWARERLLKLRTSSKVDLKKVDSTKLEHGQKTTPVEGRK